MKRKAVVLLSGGLDSAVTLFFARSSGYDCSALAVDYGQRHRVELESAAKIAGAAGASLKVMKLGIDWGGSSLLDKNSRIPLGRSANRIRRGGIPSTYVPGRNTVFLSVAASFAEAIGAGDIFIGAHTEDSSGYPDCRPGYLKAFGEVIRSGTKAGLEGRLRLRSPLVGLDKSGIIKLGHRLGVPFKDTWSCYSGGRAPCGKCDSCVLRAKGFAGAGLADPSLGKTKKAQGYA
jgi:7-cyano-7-deazaguanine synthase